MQNEPLNWKCWLCRQNIPGDCKLREPDFLTGGSIWPSNERCKAEMTASGVDEKDQIATLSISDKR